MARTWKVGVLGLGHWYSAFGLARALPEYDRAELVGVAYGDEWKRNEYARMFKTKAYATYDELLATDVDIVHISPPVAQIPEATIKAAKAGKHILLGKPMAMTMQQADEMVQAVKGAGIVCVPFQQLFRMSNAHIKRRIDNGDIGDVAVIHATGRWSIAEDWFHSGKPGWFADPKQTPGGSLIDEGISTLAQLRWLAGSECVQAEAKVGNFVHKDVAPLEDWGMATFTFANGVIATLEASWTINSPRVTGPSPKPNSLNRLEIVGTRGEIIQENLRTPTIAILAKGADNWVFERRVGDYFGPDVPGALDYLIKCIEEKKQPEATIEESRAALKMAFSAYEAAKQGSPVKL